MVRDLLCCLDSLLRSVISLSEPPPVPAAFENSGRQDFDRATDWFLSLFLTTDSKRALEVCHTGGFFRAEPGTDA